MEEVLAQRLLWQGYVDDGVFNLTLHSMIRYVALKDLRDRVKSVTTSHNYRSMALCSSYMESGAYYSCGYNRQKTVTVGVLQL